MLTQEWHSMHPKEWPRSPGQRNMRRNWVLLRPPLTWYVSNTWSAYALGSKQRLTCTHSGPPEPVPQVMMLAVCSRHAYWQTQVRLSVSSPPSLRGIQGGAGALDCCPFTMVSLRVHESLFRYDKRQADKDAWTHGQDEANVFVLKHDSVKWVDKGMTTEMKERRERQ